MQTPDENPQDILCAEILTEARRQSEKLLGRAREEADALLAHAAEEAAGIRRDRLALARSEAAHRKELILATVLVEAGRERSAAIETLLQTIYEHARCRLLARRDFDYRATILALAAEAMRRMAGDTFVVKLDAAEGPALGDGLAEAIKTRLGQSQLRITIMAEPTITEGGVLIQDAEGRQVWDNRLPARLQRLWPELRQRIAVGTSLVPGSTKEGNL